MHNSTATTTIPSRQSLPSLQPTDLPELIRLLGSCLSSDSTVQKPAENTLHEIEKRNGFCSLLFQVISNDTLDFKMRYLASICLKHSVNSYWRQESGYSIMEEEKQYLRSKMLETVNFSNWQLVVQMALSIAKINRLDFPEPWTNFFPFMMQTLQNGSELQREKALFIIGQFAREQSTRKIGVTREAFNQLAMNSLGFICQLWTYYVNQITEAATSGNHNESTNLIFKNCLSATKIITRFIMAIPNMDDSKESFAIINLILQTIIKLYSYRRECEKRQISNTFTANINKCLAGFMKVPLRAQITHLVQMRSLLPHYLQFCLQTILECDMKIIDPSDMFIFRVITFMKNVAESRKYNGESDAAHEAKDLVKVKFFNQQVLSTLTTDLISRYMLLSDEELSQWEDDPELFIKEQEMDFNGTVKSAAELLYISLIDTFDEELSPFVAKYSETLLNDTFGSFEKEKILLRDSVYSAMGWVSHYLCMHFDFSQYFRQMLSKEIQMKDPRYKIIRRRAVWLVGRWVDNIEDDILSDTFRCLLFALSEDDKVLKLSALISLKALLDEDKDVSKKVFKEFLDPFIKSTFQLLSQVEEEETKLTLLSLLTILIEKMHRDILPYAPTLMQYLPALWNQTQEEYMTKNAIVIALTKLVDTMGEESVNVHNFILPLIKYTTDIANDDTLYYLEDGLELWRSIMQQAPVMNNVMLDLFPNLPKMLSLSFDHVIPALQLVESYALLGKLQFLEQCAAEVNQIFMDVIGEVKDKPMMLCLNVLDSILALFPERAPAILRVPLLKLLKMVLVGKDTPMIKAAAICTFARIIFIDNGKIFYQLLEEVAKQIPNATPQAAFVKFMGIWFDQSDHIFPALKRKVSALGLLCLLPTQNEDVLSFFPDIVNSCVQILYETDSKIGYMLSATEHLDYDHDNSDRNEYDRKRLQMKNDRAVMTEIYPFIINKFEQMSNMMGKPTFDQLLTSRVDASILAQLSRYQQEHSSSQNLHQ